MSLRSIGVVMAIALAAAGCQRSAETAAADAESRPTPVAAGEGDCTPVETRQPNAPSQRPAFRGQTRACREVSNVAFDVEVVARGLDHPWAVEPLADGALLVTERAGRMRMLTADGEAGQPIAGLPPVDARNQGGLLDVALSPRFDADRIVYWSYSEPRQGGNGTSVARGTLSSDGKRLDGVRVIFRAQPTYDGDMHFGSRLVFGTDGMLYVTLGERSDLAIRPQAQHLDSHMGKIVRITPDGTVPDDNPFAGRPKALPEIWTLGHRNVQAAALDGKGQLWIVEHGARGGDELNRIEKGRNYGWPIVTYGIEYSGAPIAGSVTAREGFEPPVYYWDPVIAPSGAQFYTGEAFPAWRGSLFVGSLKEKRLVRLTLEGSLVTGEEHLLADRNQRVRDVREGPDGVLYIVTDEDAGEVWRIVPRRQ